MDSVQLDIDAGDDTIIDLSRELNDFCNGRGDGLCNVFVPHATAGVAIMETGAGSEPDVVRRSIVSCRVTIGGCTNTVPTATVPTTCYRCSYRHPCRYRCSAGARSSALGSMWCSST